MDRSLLEDQKGLSSMLLNQERHARLKKKQVIAGSEIEMGMCGIHVKLVRIEHLLIHFCWFGDLAFYHNSGVFH
jgi:hypothetical protein